jgi:hypothetical protein
MTVNAQPLLFLCHITISLAFAWKGVFLDNTLCEDQGKEMRCHMFFTGKPSVVRLLNFSNKMPWDFPPAKPTRCDLFICSPSMDWNYWDSKVETNSSQLQSACARMNFS